MSFGTESVELEVIILSKTNKEIKDNYWRDLLTCEV